MKTRTFLPALFAIGALTLAGCSAGGQTAPAPTSSATTTAEVDAVLATAGLQGKAATEVVDALEVSTEDRTAGPAGSVRYDHVVLTSEDAEVSMPLPDDRFYLSIAPYVEKTHECYYHSLASCQGELAGETVQVTITDADGATLVDEDATLHDNGFAGFWLPRDLADATLTVTYDGKDATTTIGTGDEDPTCLTTLKLS